MSKPGSKRIGAWIAGIGLLVLVVLAAGGYFVLLSPRFHRYVLERIVAQAEAATGARIEVRDIDFQLSRLTVHLHGITLRGGEASSVAPLVAVDDITLRLKILSFFRRKVSLEELLIAHPVIRLRVDSKGRSNLPQPSGGQSSARSGPDVFRLAVGRVALTEGEIDYNDQRNQLDAEVRDLDAAVGFDRATSAYRGSLAYQRGRIRYHDFAPLAHRLELSFSADPSALHLAPLALWVGSSRLRFEGTIAHYDQPLIEGSFDSLLDAHDFAGALGSASVVGKVAVEGQLDYASAPGRSFWQALSSSGRVTSEALGLASAQLSLPLRKLGGRYELAQGNLRASAVRAELLAGAIEGEGKIESFATTPVGSVRADWRGISLDQLKSALALPEARRLPLTGSMAGSVEASWKGEIRRLKARSDLEIHAAIAGGAGKGPDATPLAGALHARYDGSTEQITLEPSRLDSPRSSLSAQGVIGAGPRGSSNLRLGLATEDLHEWSRLAAALWPPSSSSSTASPPGSVDRMRSFELSGSGTVTGSLEGSLGNPRISAQVAAANLEFDGSAWRSLRFSAALNPAGLDLENGSLVAEPAAAGAKRSGEIGFRAHVDLDHWSYSKANRVAAHASIERVQLSELLKLANLPYPAAGLLSGEGDLGGSALAPEGHGSLQLTEGDIYGEPVQSLAIRFEASGGSLTSVVRVAAPAGSATANLLYKPKTRNYELALDAPRVALEQLRVVHQRNPGLAGVLRIQASGRGTLEHPELSATLGLSQLQVQQASVTNVNAQVQISPQRAELTMVGEVRQATIRVRATVGLGEGYPTKAQIDTSAVPLASWLAIYFPQSVAGPGGEAEIHASFEGPLEDRTKWRAHVEIPVLRAAYQQLQLANASPVRLDLADSVLTLHPSEIQGNNTTLRLEGRIPLSGKGGLELSAQGSIDLRILDMFSPDLKSSGLVNVNVRGSGTLSEPEIEGQINIHDASASTSASPLGIENVNGVLDLTHDHLQVTQLTGQLGGGQLSVGGAITYQKDVRFNLALTGKSVRLRYPDGVRTLLDGDLTLIGTPQAASINGRVLLDGLSFTSAFDLSNFINQFSAASPLPPAPGFADNVKLNVALQSTGELSATSSVMSIAGQVNLRLIGTAATPVIVGRTDLTSGDIFFMNLRYQLERGIVNFTNPNHTEPVVNLSLTATVEQYDLTLNIVGPIDKLTTGYSSDPPLAPVDIINLLARGQTTEQQATTTGLGTDSILASGSLVGSQVSSGVQKLAGLSSLQIDPLLESGTSNPSARIGMQQRLTRNFLFTFSTDVSQPNGEIVQGEYQLTKRWSVSAQRDETGGVAIDGQFRTTF
jgi:translocation and assembly module TamB